MPELRPFVKWAGGKRKLAPLYLKYFPTQFKRYFEPFVGGGAVLFQILQQKSTKNAIISDVNAELLNAYRMVRDRVEALISALENHKEQHNKDYFYEVRARDRQAGYYQNASLVERAARLIYLNKTCFNGLYRVNQKGFFNVPFGRYKNPRICDAIGLVATSKALQDVDIVEGSFELALRRAQQGDLIYFDPPYAPLSRTANFTSYSAGNFTLQDQARLASVFADLDQRGCYVAVSNSCTPLIKQLYSKQSGVMLHEIKAGRAINCDATKRGKITELLICGKTLNKAFSTLTRAQA